jgi:hypothetical protein
MKKYERVEIELHVFLTSAPNRGELYSRTGNLTAENELWVQEIWVRMWRQEPLVIIFTKVYKLELG